MSQNILVRLEIPLLADPIVNTPRFTFTRWMPLAHDESIVIESEDYVLKLWFDEGCWGRVTHAGGSINKHKNVLVDKVFADVTLLNVPDDLVEYIEQTASAPEPPESPHRLAYRQLGQKVYCVALTRVNRLIAFARSEKGQYWLREHRMDLEKGLYAVNLNFNAQVQISGRWFRWFSDVRQLVIGREGGCQDDRRFIDKESCKAVQDFVQSNRSTSLVGELVAGAEWLAGIGHTRSALTELVTALEVAVADFARHPNAERAFGRVSAQRMKVDSLKGWIDRLGLSGTVNYLLPTIFTEETLPTDLLRTCQEAIQVRQNVVHNAQRRVKKHKLAVYITAVRDTCRLLHSYCESD